MRHSTDTSGSSKKSQSRIFWESLDRNKAYTAGSSCPAQKMGPTMQTSRQHNSKQPCHNAVVQELPSCDSIPQLSLPLTFGQVCFGPCCPLNTDRPGHHLFDLSSLGKFCLRTTHSIDLQHRELRWSRF